MSKINEAQAGLNQTDLEAMRTLQRCEVQLNQLKQSLADLNAYHIEINASVQAKTQKETDLECEISRLEQQQKVLED